MSLCVSICCSLALFHFDFIYPCAPWRKPKSFGYLFMHSCYRMAHRIFRVYIFHVAAWPFSISIPVPRKWFLCGHLRDQISPFDVTPCWYIIDEEFSAPTVLTYIDCIFGVCVFARKHQNRRRLLSLHQKQPKKIKQSFLILYSSNRVSLEGGMIKILLKWHKKKRCPPLQIHEYAAIIQAGISSQYEITIKIKHTTTRMWKEQPKKKTGIDVMWFGLSTFNAFYHHPRVSVAKVTQRWTLATSFLKLVVLDAWYESKAMRRWNREGESGREHEMTMSTKKKIILLGFSPRSNTLIQGEKRYGKQFATLTKIKHRHLKFQEQIKWRKNRRCKWKKPNKVYVLKSPLSILSIS